MASHGGSGSAKVAPLEAKEVGKTEEEMEVEHHKGADRLHDDFLADFRCVSSGSTTKLPQKYQKYHTKCVVQYNTQCGSGNMCID